MSELNCKLPDIEVAKPNGLSSRLFLQVFSGPNAIAFAQLSSHSHNRRRLLVNADNHREVSLVLSVSYSLKDIEVSPHYRNQGIGSALLKEVIGFCRDRCEIFV
jgi:GNAT superfamily N-acetyltransferase